MKYLKNYLLFVAVLALNVALPSLTKAAFNETIHYQGKLNTSSGSAVTNGTYHMRFKLYTSLTGGTPIFVEDRSNSLGDRISITNGIFSTLIGSSSSLSSLDFNQTLYFEMEVGGTASTSWETLSPRKVLGTVPTALLAKSLMSGASIGTTSITNLSVLDMSSSTFAGALGVGTSTPSARLSITAHGNSSSGRAFSVADSSNIERFTIKDSGLVGIGSTTPATNLSVSGSTYATGGIGAGVVNQTTGTIQAKNYYIATNGAYYGINNIYAITGSTTNNYFLFTQPNTMNTTLTGTNNMSLGLNSFMSNTTGSNNMSVGNQSMNSNTTGSSNSTLGFQALLSNTTGDQNTATGYRAGSNITTGDYNTVSGADALVSVSSGSNNTSSGWRSLYNATGGNNTAMGYLAGFNATGGSGNIFIGASTQTALANDSYYLNIGNIIYGTSTNNSNGMIGVGTTTPSAKFSIKGNSGSGRALAISDSSNIERLTVLDNGSIKLGATAYLAAGTLMTDVAGNITVSSDERLKDIKSSFTRGLAAIQAISPITYKWNEASGLEMEHEYSGFSAQNVKEAIPEAVGLDGRGYLSLSDRPIVAALVNAIKEQQVQIAYIASSSGQSTFNVDNWLAGFGVEINNAYANFRKVIAEAFTLGSTERPAGMTIYDKTTRQPYCFQIDQGTMMSTQGECNNNTWYNPNITNPATHTLEAPEAQVTPNTPDTSTPSTTESIATSTQATSTPTIEAQVEQATSTPSIEEPTPVEVPPSQSSEPTPAVVEAVPTPTEAAPETN